ncbi:alpha/beta hydrolase [Pseudomonas sp. BN102]|uniref:alpha/beta fold hydrolase n=1 Tax=Pseudomonas sp. BN102 TaxID=2567886 RepID=UPI0024540640|nr:alpha/beta hydrolase [Pseudomonas sp. BN102]MDH4608522.1 alpha/beta hydrolase [Pseudomonas sp. BN102]
MPTPIHSRDLCVETGHGRLFACIWSADRQGLSAEDAPIVLFHDSLGCVELWRDFPAQLAAATGKAVVAYDRLGFGRSDAHPGELSVGFVGNEAEYAFSALKEQLGIRDFIAFGHSVGGGMAVHCADRHRTHCQALVTESAQAFVEDRTLAGIRVAKQGFQAVGQLERLSRYHGEKARWVLDAWTETWLSPEFAGWNLEAEVQRLDCPVLAIHGGQDEFGSAAHPQRIAQLTRNHSQVLLIDDCGHVPHRENAGLVLQAVGDFLR